MKNITGHVMSSWGINLRVRSITSVAVSLDIYQFKLLHLWSDHAGVNDNNGTSCLVFSDIMKSKSNPDFLKRQSKQSRAVRSKVSVTSFLYSNYIFSSLIITGVLSQIQTRVKSMKSKATISVCCVMWCSRLLSLTVQPPCTVEMCSTVGQSGDVFTPVL